MQSNDLLMVGGAGALVAAAYLYLGLPLALVVGAFALIYFAHTFPAARIHRPKPKPVAPPKAEKPRPIVTEGDIIPMNAEYLHGPSGAR